MSMSQAAIDDGYKAWAERLIATGWTPYLLTFMFRQLGASDASTARRMDREVERVYATHVTHVVRKPAAPSSVGRLPVWFCSPDMPVFKHAQQRISDVSVNNGQHRHAVVFHPPASRCTVSLVDHFEKHRDLYIRPELPLIRLNVRLITYDVGYVVDYARKLIRGGGVGEDSMLILPRQRTELLPTPSRAAGRPLSDGNGSQASYPAAAR